MATKTVILMDHRALMAAPTDQVVVVEDLRAKRSKWTVVMEAVVEYTRIILDICSLSHPLMVLAADDKLTFLNSWREQKGIATIVESLARLASPNGDAQHDLSLALQQCLVAAEEMSLVDIQNTLLGGPVTLHTRLVCFTSTDRPRDCVDIVNRLISAGGGTQSPVEFVLFNMVDGKGGGGPLRYEGHLIYDVTPGELFQSVIDFVLEQHSLTITTITQIPMKEEQSTNTQASSYNVDIVHPIVRLPNFPTDRLTMKWSSPKNAQNINLKNCVTSYPVSPLDVSERPTICLVNFLLVGKQVVLEYPRPELSVVLINHGGTIVMHYIANSVKSVLDDVSPISDTPGGKVVDYRNDEVKTLIRNLELCPHPLPESVECELPILRSLLELERYTAYMPLTYSQSALESCGVTRIFGILSKDTLTDREVTECQQAIYKVQGIEVKKEPISIRGKTGKRESAVEGLWEELERLILSMCHISSQHGKVRDCLYKIRGSHLSEDSLYLSASRASSTDSPAPGSTEAAVESGKKRTVEEISTPLVPFPPAKKKALTALHPMPAGEKVSLLAVLPKLICKEFSGRLSGVSGPDGLYAEMQQRKLREGLLKKSGSPHSSPHHSPARHQSPAGRAANHSPGGRKERNR